MFCQNMSFNLLSCYSSWPRHFQNWMIESMAELDEQQFYSTIREGETEPRYYSVNGGMIMSKKPNLQEVEVIYKRWRTTTDKFAIVALLILLFPVFYSVIYYVLMKTFPIYDYFLCVSEFVLGTIWAVVVWGKAKAYNLKELRAIDKHKYSGIMENVFSRRGFPHPMSHRKLMFHGVKWIYILMLCSSLILFICSYFTLNPT